MYPSAPPYARRATLKAPARLGLALLARGHTERLLERGCQPAAVHRCDAVCDSPWAA